MSNTPYIHKLGKIECTVLDVGIVNMSIPELVSNIAENKVLDALSKEGYSEASTHIGITATLLNIAGQKLMIDAGWGKGNILANQLQAADTQPEDVETIFITHTDNDHTGGLLTSEGTLLFPNAVHYITEEAWAYWTADAYLANQRKENHESIQTLLALLSEKITLIQPGDEPVPGIKIVDSPGHRSGHVALEISSQDEKLLHIADGIIHPLFISHMAWHCELDSEPILAAKTRGKLLLHAAKDDLLICASHFPFPGLGKVNEKNGAWAWQAINQSKEE